MRRWLFVAFLIVPLVDAALLVWVGTSIGWVPTVLLVVLTALLGTIFVRAEGRRTLRQLQQSLAAGRPPADELLDGGLLIAAGALLLTPGLLTDALGFLLVLPVTRVPIRSILKERVLVPRLDETTGGFVTGRIYTTGFPTDRAGESDGTTIDIDSPDDGDVSTDRNP